MRVAHAKPSSDGIIDGSDWDADHVVEGAVSDDDARLSDARTPTEHSHDTTHDHDADYADLGHTHDTSHVHTAAEVGAAATGHTHDATHSHDLSGYALVDHSHAATEGVPAGVIAMWAGNVQQVPDGWLLCDGQNGTPDLTDRFIKGGTPGSTGGSATHTHAAHSGVISHTHDVAVTDPGHKHVETSNNATTGPSRGWGAADTSTNTETVTGYSTASSTTGITANASAPAGAVNELTHDSVSNEPAYYTLAFIQKA